MGDGRARGPEARGPGPCAPPWRAHPVRAVDPAIATPGTPGTPGPRRPREPGLSPQFSAARLQPPLGSPSASPASTYRDTCACALARPGWEPGRKEPSLRTSWSWGLRARTQSRHPRETTHGKDSEPKAGPRRSRGPRPSAGRASTKAFASRRNVWNSRAHGSLVQQTCTVDSSQNFATQYQLEPIRYFTFIWAH